MGFIIDNKEWLPETTAEHATKWMEKINAILEENNVTDADGNIIKLSQSFANALYLQVLAGANRLAANDEKLQQAINSFNIELCDDQQIENLLPIASITRNQGSYSTLVLTCTAKADGDCTIPAGTKAPYGNVNFVVQNNTFIEAGTTVNIETVCDTVGAIAVLSGEVTAFENQIPNLESVVNTTSSIPGNAAETTASLRRRIQKGQTIPYSLDGVKQALEELTGIKHARVYFNPSPETDLTLPGDIDISPRHAYIVINGSSDELAKTYAKYMNAPTQNAPDASPTGTYSTVDVVLTAGLEAAEVPAGTSFSFSGVVFQTSEDVTVEAESSETVTFTAIEVGAIVIPADSITLEDLEPSIDNLVNATNNSASTPGIPKTAYEQNYITASGQTIPIKYDSSDNQIVFVKVVYKADSDSAGEDEITNQIKRDLIASSASWTIGQTVTSLLTSSPFTNITYANVAYTQVSTDGEIWTNAIDISANSIPIVNDSSIYVEQLS